MIDLIFLLISVGLLLLIGTFMIVPLQFGLHYIKTASKKKFYIYGSLFGILIRIPIHTKRDENVNNKIKKKNAVTKESSLSFDTFRENVDAFCDVVKVGKNELTDMLSYVRKHLSCKEMDFRIAFGLDDAAKTGITTGAVWTSGTLLLKTVDSLIGIKKIHMDVFPDFKYKRFEISFKTILVMRPVHFIKIYSHIKKTTRYVKYKLSNIN